jgi:hypothetical protein
LRAAGEIVIWQNLHSAGRHNGRCGFGKQKNLERRRLFAPLFLVQTRHRENLKRSTEVQHLDILEDDYANLFSIHSWLPNKPSRPGFAARREVRSAVRNASGRTGC